MPDDSATICVHMVVVVLRLAPTPYLIAHLFALAVLRVSACTSLSWKFAPTPTSQGCVYS